MPPILDTGNPKIKAPCSNETMAGLGEVGKLASFQEKRRCPSIADHNQQLAGATSPTYHSWSFSAMRMADMVPRRAAGPATARSTMCCARASPREQSAYKSPARPTKRSSRAQAKTVHSAHCRKARARGSRPLLRGHKRQSPPYGVSAPFLQHPGPPSPPLGSSRGGKPSRGGRAPPLNKRSAGEGGAAESPVVAGGGGFGTRPR